MKLLKFSAEWCQPCKQMEKTLKNVQIEYTEIDVEREPEKALMFGIRGVPTMVILGDDQKEVSRKVGAMSENTLLGWLDTHNFN